MKTRRTSPLARSGFHLHFIWVFNWGASSGKKARHLDVSHKFLLLWIKIINEQCIGARMSDLPARAGGWPPLSCLYGRFSALLGEISGSQWRDLA